MTIQQLAERIALALRMTDAEWAMHYGEPEYLGARLRENALENLEAEALASGISPEEVKEAGRLSQFI